MTEELRIELDLDIGKWPLIDKMDFEDAVGMSAEKALELLKAGIRVRRRRLPAGRVLLALRRRSWRAVAGPRLRCSGLVADSR
jgi:hypothetical protein